MSKSIATECSSYWPGIENYLKIFGEFSRIQAAEHALFFWHGTGHQKILLYKTLNFLAQRKENTPETNKMHHNNPWFIIPF